jgi:hypothetical protein
MQAYEEWKHSSAILGFDINMEASGQFHVLAALPLEKQPLKPTGQEDRWVPKPV